MFNSLEILKKLGSSTGGVKKTFSIYIDEKLWMGFREACGNVSASEVLEHLIEAFLVDLAEKKTEQQKS